MGRASGSILEAGEVGDGGEVEWELKLEGPPNLSDFSDLSDLRDFLIIHRP
jgi:hypothetical protein